MIEVIKFGIGIFVLALGILIGLFLAKITSEELKSGQKWFKLIMLISGAGAIASLIIQDDVYLFSFLFILIVTFGSLRNS